MKKEKLAIASGILAFIAPFLCCVAPVVAIVFGASAASAASAFTEKYQPLFWAMALLSFAWAAWQFYSKWRKKGDAPMLQSVIACPKCGFKKEETMPENACTYFYDCQNCHAVLKPKLGDCCVFCSYGTVKCPSIQLGEDCCK